MHSKPSCMHMCFYSILLSCNPSCILFLVFFCSLQKLNFLSHRFTLIFPLFTLTYFLSNNLSPILFRVVIVAVAAATTSSSTLTTIRSYQRPSPAMRFLLLLIIDNEFPRWDRFVQVCHWGEFPSPGSYDQGSSRGREEASEV
jgi:hypothetical protein